MNETESFEKSEIKRIEQEELEETERGIVREINDLNIKNLPEIDVLYPVEGISFNFEYELENKTKIKLLVDDKIYLGTEIEVNENNTYIVVADKKHILISRFDKQNLRYEIILYKKR